MRHQPLRVLVLAPFMVMSVAAAPARQDPRGASPIPKPPTILFMCPHGAAKSVLASAYFQRVAKERGLNVRVESAGTEPDATVSPAVAAHLTRHGYEIPVTTPRQATSQDLASADVVIAMGCDLTGLPQPSGKLMRWDDLPALSDEFSRADDAIRKRVVELVEELVRAAPKKP